jgi:hypothetical protein
MPVMAKDREVMHSPIDAVWDWSYLIDEKKLEQLYAKAKLAQWNADVAIDWSVPVDPGGRLLDAERASSLRKFPITRQSCTRRRKRWTKLAMSRCLRATSESSTRSIPRKPR